MKFNPDDYITNQIIYKSKDGTDIPMFLVHKKNLKLNGDNPTELYGYGGFSDIVTPSFSAARFILLENNGIYAAPSIRGGGDFGENWHEAGILEKKQNTFDDFIAAAEYLINNNYTSSSKLAISGVSNGGLVVGAVMTQRPDLFKVAFPDVGVLDMLRYDKFTVGKGWVLEFGSSNNFEQFSNLIKYSPLHNLKTGVKYPATMITTGDRDNRVVPAHSFKFAAQLQKIQIGNNPILIRIETNVGHGAGTPTYKTIEKQTDKWSFFFFNTHSPVKY